jgi:hypothetical protein
MWVPAVERESELRRMRQNQKKIGNDKIIKIYNVECP